MKLLKDLTYGINIKEIKGSTNVAVDQLAFDSRKVVKFTLFVAVKGTQVDGHEYIEAAISSGAVCVVCQKIPKKIHKEVTYIVVQNSAKALGVLASNYYDNPSEKLKLIGVTGTNGKTTSVTLLFNLFRLLGFKVGLLSTVENKIHNEVVPSTHTTPSSLELNELLNKMVTKGCQYVFMEVSSHAVDQHRISGLTFQGGVFTNITRDHLDYHKTFDNYIAAKKGFFDLLGTDAFALYNVDQSHGETMVLDTKAKVVSYGMNSVCDYKVKIIENRFDGMTLNLDGIEVDTKLIGDFNAYNLLVAYSVGNLLGYEKIDVLTTLSSLSAPEGRFQHITSKTNITSIIDYAHTPDALENVLQTINNIRLGKELVITVVGCGGDRDKGKRPIMAEIACRLSDQVIFTSDNPRSENPDDIISEMQKGVGQADLSKTLSITNRKEAIKTACSIAHGGDILLVAGKGHEKYQEINGEVIPFDDMEIVKENLKIMNK
ncbi:MAG: UDP-N-acetylmuramoyl-L-alanyl-D-glutamate--2,6-diaminopimelate ligase [Crocinitomicaceae bacterium]|nr:UDP-N-acetylmuramoyl-L-alanyl-D-glutamate--2,6-diaminopimelate ligase [Crocinitomicaceae bacterium]|tara:strand:+ start:1655 stop:3118 length:1464 start_codon:yes stop_codon:yes gene_type:complete